MPPPVMYGKDLIIVLKKAGFKVVGQRGNHVSLRKGPSQLIIPQHEKLADATLNAILEQAGIESAQFTQLLAAVSGVTSEPVVKSIEKPVSVQPVQWSIDEPEEEYTIRGAKQNLTFQVGFFSSAWHASTRAFPLAVYRMVLGVLFLVLALSKAPWLNFGWFEQLVDINIKYSVFSFLHDFLLYVVKPHIMLFGYIQFFVELGIGLSLLFGFFTRFWSFVGIFWVLFLWLTGAGRPTEWLWTDVMMFSSMVLMFSMSAGRTLGFDQKLSELFERHRDESFLWEFMCWFV